MDGIPGIRGVDLERVKAFIRRRISPSDDPADIMQDVFLALVSRWNMGEKIHDAMAWMLTAAARRAVDALRRRSRAPGSLDSGPDLDAGDILELADAGADAGGEAMEREELRAAIERAISGLPAEQRDVFVMNEIDGMGFNEIQARTGVPLNTLLARKRYAVMKLREKLVGWFNGIKEA